MQYQCDYKWRPETVLTATDELYDPAKPGVVLLRKVFPRKTITGALDDLQAHRADFAQKPAQYGTTRQGLATWDITSDEIVANEHIAAHCLFFEYTAYLLHRHYGSSMQYPTSERRINASFYPKGSVGIGPHRDNSFSINFIAIAVVSGSNSFYTARNKERDGEIELAIEPGDVVLMRGPRSPAEHDWRPVHYVKTIEADRYILVYREINHALKNKIDGHRQYNA